MFWRAGSQVVSLNWQTYDTPMQVNEAMFVGTPGWVAKPEKLRVVEGEEGLVHKFKNLLHHHRRHGGGRKKLSAEIYGVSARECFICSVVLVCSACLGPFGVTGPR